ncbi:MAG: ABC transporter permease [Bacteroidetes bacterium]|nr:ABC transporter permease [Bacteroidota bacterium]
MLYLQLAWRNLWRNKRRTIISAASVFLAVFLALLTRSMQLGSYNFMIENVVRLSTGYMQIHQTGYWNTKSIDLALPDDPAMRTRLMQMEHVTQVIPRLQSFALAASNQATRGAMIQGINPGLEDRLNSLSGKISAGSYLEDADSSALVADGLARYLGLGVGDTVVLYGMGYHGTTAAGQFPIRGIVRFSLPEMNASFVYLSLHQAQTFLEMPRLINSLSVMIDLPRHQTAAYEAVSGAFGRNYEVLSWQQMMPEVVQGIAVDNAGGIIMIAILYVVVGFGIFGTVMMMTLERRREFGVLSALGMKRGKITLMVLAESVLLSILGVVSGTIAAFPLMLYFANSPFRLSGEAAEAMLKLGLEPLLPLSVQPSIFISQTLTVLAIAMVSTVYPALVLRRLEPVQAMHT